MYNWIWNFQGLPLRAVLTCPLGIRVELSSIRGGGLGAFTDFDIEKNTVFGPYQGDIIDKNDIRKYSRLFEGGYAWEVCFSFFYRFLFLQSSLLNVSFPYIFEQKVFI